MQKSINALEAGLNELCANYLLRSPNGYAQQYGRLIGLVAYLVEGAAHEKKASREHLKKIIGRGRCILNARDFEASLKKGVEL